MFQLTPTGQTIKSEDVKNSLGTLPKFQFAFGGRETSSVPVIKTEPGLVIVKSEPLETSNGKTIQASTTQPQQNSVSPLALKGSNLISLPSKPGAQIIVHNSAISQSPVLSGQATLQASPSAASHADLIKQLNQARAQGLVVLQQWGDKQVLTFTSQAFFVPQKIWHAFEAPIFSDLNFIHSNCKGNFFSGHRAGVKKIRPLEINCHKP